MPQPPSLATMSFSATILLTSPGQGQAGPGARAGGAEGTPATVDLLHLIYQRLQSLSSTAQEALAVAHDNRRLLRGLEREVRLLTGWVTGQQQLATSPPPGLSPNVEQEQPVIQDPTGQEQPKMENEVCEHWGPGPCRVVRVSPSPSPPPPVPVSLCPPALGPEGREEPDVGPASEDSSGPAFLLTGGGPGSSRPTGSEPSLGTATRPNGARTSRRKRDVVLSKMVHSVHNHVSNDRRFNGAERQHQVSLEHGRCEVPAGELKRQLSASPHPHPYTDKELKGACVAYFLTKRREYRNAMNPHRSLKEREEKKLRSRRYRLFASRAAMVRLFSLEDLRLWEGASEELMSDEEDSPLEPGVWVARSPRFRSPQLTDLCRRLDASSRHGLRPNRLVGPPSDRLPSLPLPLNFPLPLPSQAEGRPPCIQVKLEGDE